VCDSWHTVENTLLEDGDASNTFRAFNPTQAEETYSMVTASRFWSSEFVFGIAPQALALLHAVYCMSHGLVDEASRGRSRLSTQLAGLRLR